jgi:UPF0755 protein
MAKKKSNKTFGTIIILLALVLAAFFIYKKFIGARVQLNDRTYIYIFIRPGDDFSDLMEELEETGVIAKHEGFQWLAERMELPQNLHPGRFRITNGMNLRQIINLLKYNKQEKVKLSLNSQIHNLDEFVLYLDDKLGLEAGDIESLLTDEKLLDEKFGLDPDNCFALIVPGTYEVSWAISREELIDLLAQRYKKLWAPERLAQCKRVGFRVAEIVTLASIVQSESAIESEQEKIAGVYINRLKKNMPLQADPTLKFANGNFGVSRVLDADKEIKSPYNTYRHKGLPPGPICLVSQQAIDATLNYGRHNYLYFCAKPQLNGFSDFSQSYEQHRRHAAAYQKALDKIGISR